MIFGEMWDYVPETYSSSDIASNSGERIAVFVVTLWPSSEHGGAGEEEEGDEKGEEIGSSHFENFGLQVAVLLEL